MRRNQVSAGESVSEARSHGRRQSTAETRATPRGFRLSRLPTTLTGRWASSAGDLRPGVHPLLEWHAVVLAVSALRERRLPELEALEVRVRLVGVQPRAPALLQRV